MIELINGIDLTGVVGDLRAVILGSLALGLIMAAAFMIARLLGVRLGGLDDD